ncbi:MAG: tRNA-intron lyase [Candidatus Bathyarchaeia archaeon]|nr:tRNA-intron lyase [Candidatus Bathyarchaeota archaeon]
MSKEKIVGVIEGEGVKIRDKGSIEELKAKGYGVGKGEELLLKFYEALYLKDKGILDVVNSDGEALSFNDILQIAEGVDENIWAKYLVYRDLRSRGYVVRGGFGLGIDFRVYDRGDYGKDAAKYLIMTLQEGKPIKLERLTQIIKQCRSLKKDLILAVMSRRGEIVYYSVSQLTF